MSLWQRSSSVIPNSIVDLTTEGSSPSSSSPSSSTAQTRLYESQLTASTSISTPPPTSAGPSRKRTRRGSRPASSNMEAAWTTTPRMNLTNDITKPSTPMKNSPSVPASEKPLRLSTLTCVICLMPPTELTATICGHLFCHSCLTEALIAGENRASHGEPKRSQCPVCRRPLNRQKRNTDIIPLLLRKEKSSHKTMP